ncbi:O-antigen ligase family protein [Moritella sp. 24]|uniref:O-antigen ligase family protein n=1 Tax=Moritella sp. 24 TaxID=2746230 RepID=UPI001BA4B3A3|nr:O-antigen ligase family protein [Moritella sp. 24]QUM74919.1 O-antigen ligase family protein [Moritella sp. 24]
MLNLKKEQLLNYCAFIVPITMMMTSATISLSIAIMFFMSLYLWKTQDDNTFKSNDLKYLCFLYIAVFILTIPHVIMDDFKANALDTPSRYLLAAGVVYGFRHYQVKFETFLKGCIVGSFIGFLIYIVYGDMYLHSYRLDFKGGMGILHIAYISLAIFSITLVGSKYFFNKKMYTLSLLSIVGAIFTSYIILRTGTRGAFVGLIILPLLFVVLATEFKKIKKSHMIITFILLFSSIFIIFKQLQNTDSAMSKSYMVKRMLGEKDILNYTPGTGETSLTIRFEIWRSSVYQFMDSPIFGLGYKERKVFHNNLIKEGIIEDWVWSRNGEISGHNEIFNIIGTKGLVGLSFILALYLLPLRFFYRRLKNTNEQQFIAMAGIMLIVSFMITGLTEAPLMKHKTAVLYSLFIFILYRACLTLDTNRKDISENA